MAESTVIGSVATSPMLTPAKTRKYWGKELNKLSESHPARVSLEFQPSLGTYSAQIKLCAPGPVGLGMHLQSSHSHHRRRRRPLSPSMICASALQEQTQTIIPEAPTTIPNPPAKEKSPELDGGGTGFPPRRGGGGGGDGGGGGGGDCSGGLFLFGILAFLDFLKDLERKRNSRDGQRSL